MTALLPFLPYLLAGLAVLGLFGAYKVRLLVEHHTGFKEGQESRQAEITQLDADITAAKQANDGWKKALDDLKAANAVQSKQVADLEQRELTAQAAVKVALQRVADTSKFYTSEVGRLQAIAHSTTPLTGDDCAKTDTLLHAVYQQRLHD